MEKRQPGTACALCGAAAASAPRLFVLQERHLDAEKRHEIPLCEQHGIELRAGVLAPHQIIFNWARRVHDELYENSRLVLRPELRCLSCNALLREVTCMPADRLQCADCAAHNVLGTALGHRVAVRLGKDGSSGE